MRNERSYFLHSNGHKSQTVIATELSGTSDLEVDAQEKSALHS